MVPFPYFILAPQEAAVFVCCATSLKHSMPLRQRSCAGNQHGGERTTNVNVIRVA